MNNLPYQNEMFDVVLMSATSHHSPDLPGLMTRTRSSDQAGRLGFIAE